MYYEWPNDRARYIRLAIPFSKMAEVMTIGREQSQNRKNEKKNGLLQSNARKIEKEAMLNV